MVKVFLEDYLETLKVVYNEIKATTPEILLSLNFVSEGPGLEVVTAYYHTLDQGLKNLRSIQKNSELEGLIQHIQKLREHPDWGFGIPLLCCFEKPGQSERNFWFSLCQEKFGPPVQAGRN